MSWSASWLPRHLAERRAPLPAPGAVEAFAGTLLRADIPGFTARAERLGGAEQLVSEDLARAVDQAFGPLLRAVDAAGGSVAGLEGDAVLALFCGPLHAERAAEALAQIHQARPGLRALSATGEVRALHLGHEEYRAEVLHGPALDALERLERGEPAGEVAPGTEVLRGGDVVPIDLGAFVPPPLRRGESDAACHRRVVAIFLEAPLAAGAVTWEVVADEADAHAVTLLKARAQGGQLVLLVVAGAPTTHEDDGARALGFAMAVRDRLADEGGIRVKVALSEGMVLGLVIGNQIRASYDVFGDAVNVASRLLEHTRPGEVLSTATLLDQARDWRGGPVRVLALRGKTRPVAARPVEGAVDSPREFLDPHFIRPKELEQLGDALVRGGAVAIVGAPGMGKRKLWQQYSARFPGRVLRASCHDYGAVRPLAPFSGMLRRLAEGTQTRAGIVASLAAQPGMNDRAVSALGSLVGHGSPQIGSVVGALRQLLTGMAVAGPTLLVVEDWQWADGDTRALIERLLPDVERIGLRLILTSRPRAALPEGIHVITAPPLDRATARELVARTGGGELTPRLVDEIVERGAGNPRDLVALAEAARQGGDELPASLESWYASRVDALPEVARDVIERAAIVGRTVERGLLRRLCADVPGMEEALQLLIDRRLLTAIEGGSRLRFDRDPMREIVYMRLPSERRRRLHGRYGRVLQHRAEVGDALAPETIAWHLSRSDRPADAIPALVEASRRALANGRPRLSVSHAEQAARLARQYAPEKAAEVQRQLGDAMLRVGRADLALEAFRAAGDPGLATELAGALLDAGFAREALVAVGENTTAAGAAVRARAKALLGDPSAEAGFQEALSAAQTPSDRARALRFYGVELARADRHGEAIQALSGAVEASRHAHDRGARAEAEEMLGRSLAVIGRVDEALALHRDAFAIREADHDVEGAASSLRSLARTESLAGQHTAALGHLLAARSILRDLGLETRLLRLEVDLAEVRMRRGELDRARQHLARATDAGRRTRARHATLLAWVDPTLANALHALDLCTEDRWRAGAAFSRILVATLGGGGDVQAALGELRQIGHAEFIRLAEQRLQG